MLQRQIMFKQLEELQRQKKLQELNDSRQQNVINQQSLIHNKQASGAQYAPLINGTPVRDPSQMFMFGNTNLVHGFQNAQNQLLRSMGLASQPVDAHSFGRISHFQGATRESTGEQVDTVNKSCMSDQFNISYQERNMFGPGLSQGLDMACQTGIDQQEFGRGQEQEIINPCQDFSGLDPLEQKFLSDDNHLGGFGNMFEDNDNLQAFPTLQSGSWSALMQSALEETSSTDTGVQEEWSGLSFQNPELSNDNQPSNLMESGKHPTPWQHNIFQNAPSLNSTQDHLKTSDSSSRVPGFQQTHKEAREFEASAKVQRVSPLQVHQGPSGHLGEFSDAPDNGREFKKGFLPDRSTEFPASDSNAQTSHHMLELLHKVDKFREYRHGAPTAYTISPPTDETHKSESSDAFTPSNNSHTPQYFGLRLAPPIQKPPMSYFDLSQISQQVDGQRSLSIEDQQIPNSTRQPNVWVDIPSQQNLSGAGFYKAQSRSPSTSDVANSKIETATEATKESDSQICIKGGNELLEGKGLVLNSQDFDYKRGQEGKIPFEEESFSGRADGNASSLKQAHISPLNPTIKNERIDSDTKVPQLTPISQLPSVYENYKTLLMPSAATDQLVKNSSPLPLRDTSQMLRNSSFVQMNLASTSQYGGVRPVTGLKPFAANQLSSPYLQHLEVPNQDFLFSQSKKRKFPIYELLPWHKETTKGSSRPQDMSIAEQEWAQAANRIPEKLKEEAEALGDSPLVHSKKRIILTTQLMQVLFRPAPAAILSEDATACYDTLTYFAARLALGDACSLANRSHKPCDISDSLSGKAVTSKGSGDQNLSKIVEEFINRAKKLEDELLRLENGGSVLEIRMESQDLERFSVINRFAKFHTRPQMVTAAETASSGGGSTVPKLYPQRYVTASAMPRIVPEGHNCLSL